MLRFNLKKMNLFQWIQKKKEGSSALNRNSFNPVDILSSGLRKRNEL